MIRNIYAGLLETFPKLREFRISMIEANYNHKHVIEHIQQNKNIKLNRDEIEAIKTKWRSIIPRYALRNGYEYFHGLKCLDIFNPDMVPHSYLSPYIIKKLNKTPWYSMLDHKSLQQLIYDNSIIKYPRTIVRTYAGVYFDEKYKPILKEEAAEIIRKSNGVFLFKPAAETGQGKGIILLNTNSQFDKISSGILDGSLLKKGDFMIQEFIHQCEETKKFNPSSFNCFRVTSFMINNKVSINSCTFKCGAKGKYVDNLGSGKNGILIGVDKHGNLMETGFYGNGEKGTSHNGISFKGKKIPEFAKILDAVYQLHPYLNQYGMIGWDIGLDENYKPILIEANTGVPGISVEQMCTGPIFGDRTEEVIDYVRSTPPH